MAAPVTSLQLLKLPPGPSPLTPEQTYWRTFKSQQQFPSSTNSPVTHISFPQTPLNGFLQSDHFAVTTGRQVKIFSIRSRKLVKTISRFDDIAHGAEIRHDGRVLVAGDETGAIQVFDVNSRAILKTWTEHKLGVWVTRFSPTETTTLMSASDDKTLRIWDLPSERSTVTFIGHQDYVRSGNFLPQQASGLIVSGSYDQTVKLWDPRAPSKAIMTFNHGAPLEAVLPMPGGTTILAAADNRISVLDIVAGRPLQMLQNHQKTVTSLCFASNNSRLVSGSLDGHVKVYETTGWNVVAGSKYSSPILSLSVISQGSGQEDRHIAVGMHSGLLSIKTRLTGQQKVKERERQKEMQALLEGKIEELDRKRARKKRGRSGKRQGFTGEGADVMVEGNRRQSSQKLRPWEKVLQKGKYAEALDMVLKDGDMMKTMTLLSALRQRTALRNALSDRDEASLQPIFKWTCRYITDPRYVGICTEISVLILDLYAANMGQSKEIDSLTHRLHWLVRREVANAQQAQQTQGMLGMLIEV